jgi:predicted nucleic acid-binding protein
MAYQRGKTETGAYGLGSQALVLLIGERDMRSMARDTTYVTLCAWPPSRSGAANLAGAVSRPIRPGVPTLVAPHLVDVEVAQALRRRVHSGGLAPLIAADYLSRWSVLGVERVGVTAHLDRVWELRDNVTAHDAAYVVVAESLGCPLLTADRRLANASGVRCTITVVRT